MKYTLFLLNLLIVSGFNVSLAQEKTLLNIEYEFKHKRDIENQSHPYKTTMVLSLGTNYSRFVEESMFKSNSKAALEARKKQRELSAAAAVSNQTVRASGQPLLNVTNAGPHIKEEIFIDKQKNLLINSGRIGFRNYYYSIEIPTLKFDLKSERKKILGYDCQKAITNFGGRNYEIWFTTALPYSFGPWKLQGLPGVILEAVDGKDEVSFIAKEISKTTDPDELMIQYMDPEEGIKVKEKEYRQTSERLLKDPESIIAAQFPNTKISIRNTENPENKNIIRVKKYNPIELR